MMTSSAQHMINLQLIEYIRQQLAAGRAKEDLKKILSIQGWDAKDIEDGFAALETAPVPPLATAPVSAAAPISGAAQATVSAVAGPRPSSIAWFEILMYAAIAAGIAVSLIQYGEYIMSGGAWLLILIMLVFGVARLVLIYLTAHRGMNWARVVLLALFATNLTVLLAIVGELFRNPILALIPAAPIALEVAALCFVFSSSANRWFNPLTSNTVGILTSGVDNVMWSKGIPRANTGFMIASLGLVFVLDLSILVSSPELAPFFVAMLIVLSGFAVFYYLENSVYKKKFSHSHSRLDVWISALVVLRNLVFVLNFIPFIQLIGGLALVTGGIPYLIVYITLLSVRSKATKAVYAS